MAGRAILTAINNEGATGHHASGGRSNPQRVQVTGLQSETLTDVERFQEFGLETYPVGGATAEAVLLSPDGARDNAFVVVIQDKEYRPIDLSEGDVCLYGIKDVDAQLHRLLMKSNGTIEVKTTEDFTVLVPSGKKLSLGNGTDEILDILDQLFTKLQGNVDQPGAASTGTLSLILADLATLQTKLQNLKV